jgi:hypothetical protein
MRPPNARLYKLTSQNRLTVAEPFIPEWLDREAGAPKVFCLPLIWTREIELPVGSELGAWYVWDGRESTEDWRVSPKLLQEQALDTMSARHQAAVIYEASIEESDRKYRMSCPVLFAQLRGFGTDRVWITVDPPSFSIWTDHTYQAWHGSLIKGE